jgi:metal-dependent amidase/aminoacylase/carboxypeptidase family protein
LLEKGICDMPTAFRASYGSGSPKISFLAEYDALPEIGHACGHNLIAIAAIGAAASVKKAVDLCGGTVYVIGTPAEELIGGKVKMAKEGIFNRFDAAMMVHPGTYDTATITALAAVALDIEFIGREAHASAHPVTDGGRAANIIPARSAANFLVRAENKEALEKLKGKALTCFTDAAKQVGARLNYKWGDSAYAPMLNNTLLASLFIDNMKQLGCQMPLSDEREKFGSTDMGNVSQVVPAIHPMLSIANENISVHSPEFADAAASEQGLNAIILSSKALAMTAIDLLTTPKHITEIRQEFIESL